MKSGDESRNEIRAVIQEWLDAEGLEQPSAWRGINLHVDPAPPENDDITSSPVSGEEDSRYDFDLAEFPLFSLHKNTISQKGREPLVYTDTISGQDGKPTTRTWKTYPGPFGFGGSTTQVLLYDLLQLYCEQGARGAQIQFGTLRSLFRRHTDRNPSKENYDRLRRDLDILRGYDFHCTNAFWDRERRAYVDMRWRLFGSVFYFKSAPDDPNQELPFGFIEVSPVLQQIARTRGFFSLGFGSKLFYRLKPLEQRLAIYLSKKFVSQKLHRRFVLDLARALPIEAANESNVRKILTRAARGLIAAEMPLLASFRFEMSATGKWLVVFERKLAPRQDHGTYRKVAEESAGVLFGVDRITEALGSDDDRVWWTQCVKRLGTGAVDRALGLLKEARQSQAIRNPGGLLTRLFQKIAQEQGVSLN
jgi:hypothetical protein